MDKDLSGLTPYKYVGSHGLAYVEVIALFHEIKMYIEQGYSISSIFRMYSDEQKIADYTFNTFRRAILKAGLKEKRSSRSTQEVQPKPLQNKVAQRPRPHEMARQQRQIWTESRGEDHIGLSK